MRTKREFSRTHRANLKKAALKRWRRHRAHGRVKGTTSGRGGKRMRLPEKLKIRTVGRNRAMIIGNIPRLVRLVQVGHAALSAAKP